MAPYFGERIGVLPALAEAAHERRSGAMPLGGSPAAAYPPRCGSEARSALLIVRTSSEFWVARRVRDAWANSGRASGPADGRGCAFLTGEAARSSPTMIRPRASQAEPAHRRAPVRSFEYCGCDADRRHSGSWPSRVRGRARVPALSVSFGLLGRGVGPGATEDVGVPEPARAILFWGRLGHAGSRHE
jgi:hypothetical protein